MVSITIHDHSFHSTTKCFVVRCNHSSVQDIDEKSNSLWFPPLKAAKRVILVRHGQSTWNAEGRIQGSSDFSVLTKKGESQAEISRQMLAGDNFDACFARSTYLSVYLLFIGCWCWCHATDFMLSVCLLFFLVLWLDQRKPLKSFGDLANNRLFLRSI